MRLLKMAGYTVLRLLGNLIDKVENPGALKGKVWLYVVSQNNYESLQFLKDNLPDTIFVAGQSKEIGRYNAAVERLSLRHKLLYYYKYPPLFFQFLKQKHNSILRFPDLLYDAMGFYEVYLAKLNRYKPKAIVFANDHNADARAMLLAAKASGIKTAYIQHASVSSLFPPLEFDLNLLEGQDALDKYKQCGPISGTVKLIGMPKADAFLPFRNHSQTIKRIGIGCNLMDSISELEKLVKEISQQLPALQIIIRPHPRDTRSFSFLSSASPNVTISDSSSVKTFDYLRLIDVQVSGNSGIHLEAVLLNVWSIYYDFNPAHQLEDYYGFIKSGLIDKAGTPFQLVNLIQSHLNSKPEVILRAKYYNATVGNEYDGRSSNLAVKYIKDFIS
ncbi:hypothetical protein ACSX1A_08185 [Pontibacter sp. MBLB2868]|uniref:hypothetical protein n=1 Tax=Pontibacter sp. MBLB2868 TaxID=3451555 RepID=UPI003F74E05E